MYPLKFEPILKQTLWGGDKIIPFKHLNETLPNVSESWEVSAVEGSESVVANGADKGYTLPEMVRKYKEELVGEANYARFGNKFPLLIKFIDAKLDLSIQVHPGDELAKKRHNSFGKNEMWYVIAADKGAKLISGFAEEITPKEYKDRVHNGTFAEVLQTCAIEPGDVFYVPAGRVHGIGAGAFVAEIQQTSDITYRIFDYNRKDKDGKSRELHTSQAMDAINFSDVQDDFRTEYERVQNEPVEMVASPYFTTSVYDMTEEITCDYSELDSFVIFICVEGSCRLTDDNQNEITLRAGETVLLPAAVQEVTIVPEDQRVKLLETYV
ncbi:MAG: mannose-6-phosphate isomerase [Bacteroides stercoris]|nr:mannose-6-phosphate isomerase [Bacteroides stercoris]